MEQPSKLASNFVVLDDEFRANIVELTPDLYERINDEFKGFAGHLLISSYSFDEDWPAWEIHPAGDEFVVLLSGDVDMILARDGGDETIRMNEPGTFVIVPKNTWHTAHIRRPAVMIFITPGEGTINAEEPDRDA